jgi:hypothetical protein
MFMKFSKENAQKGKVLLNDVEREEGYRLKYVLLV